MSVTKQNFYASFGGLWNLPDPTSGSSTPLDKILVIGTPTNSEITFGLVIEGKQLLIAIKGAFQYASDVPPKNLLEAKTLITAGSVTAQEFTMESVVLSREQYSPSVSFNDFDLMDTDKVVAARVYGGNDTFIGAKDSTADDGSDTIDGFSGNDVFYGNGVGKWDDSFYGGDGVDTSVFRGKRADYTINPSDTLWNNYTRKGELTGVYVKDTTGRDGQQQLSGVERLKFSDVSVALDLNGNAGTAVKILGAVFGKSAAANKEYVGIGLDLLDKGMSYDTLAGLALSVAKANTNDQIVTMLWTNVVGSAPTTTDKAPFIQMLQNGMTPGALAHLAAETGLNTTNINLVGLAQTGVEYMPIA